MKCAVHADVDATGYCRNCGKALCPECTREVRGALYCESCLAAMVGAPQAAPVVKSDVSPGLALALGFIPGLGAVYNGEYIKALIHVVIFGGLIAIHKSVMNDMNVGPMVVIHVAIACFYFYMPIEAYLVAKARREGRPAPPGPLGEKSGSRPVGAFVLIILGILFLLANFGVLREEWFAKAWPVGLIALGIYLLWGRMGRSA